MVLNSSKKGGESDFAIVSFTGLDHAIRDVNELSHYRANNDFVRLASLAHGCHPRSEIFTSHGVYGGPPKLLANPPVANFAQPRRSLGIAAFVMTGVEPNVSSDLPGMTEATRTN